MSPMSFSTKTGSASTPFFLRIGHEQLREFGVGAHAQVFPVVPAGLLGIELGPDLPTFSSEKASMSCCIENISCSVPGFQPSMASMFTKASGK